MAKLPYIDLNPNKIFSALKMYSRAGNFPLDPTSVFNTKEDAEAYISEAGSYAYAGQLLAVANGTMSTSSPTDDGVDFTIYVIRKDMTLQEVGRDLVFDSTTAAEAYVTLNSAYVKPGTAISVLTDDSQDYDLYLVKPDKTLSKVSFDASTDIPEMSWDNITDKPTSSVTDIDASVTLYKKFTEASEAGTISYNGKVLAYVEDLTWDKIQNKPDFAALYAAKEHTHDASDITAIDFGSTSVTGVLPLSAIPAGAKEEVFTAATLDELATPTWLDGKTVNKNDWIHVASVQDSGTSTTSAKMYYVTDETKLGTEQYADGIEEIPLGTAAAVAWANVTGKPDFDATYVKTANVVSSASSANAGKILSIGSDGKLAASITGDAATLNGKADSAFAAASHTHASGDITSLEWSKLTSVPTTVDQMGLTDALTDADTVAASGGAASANKILLLNAEGKLAASITGDAATLESHPASYFATADHNHALADLTGTLSWTKLDSVPTTVADMGLTDALTDDDASSTAVANKLLYLNDDGKLPASITGDAATVGGHAASAFAQATHTHAISDVTNLQTTIDGIIGSAETGSSITHINLGNTTLVGKISLDNMPSGALERMKAVASQEEMLALTTADVQNGDLVKIADPEPSKQKVYYVKDDTQFSSLENGYEIFPMGTAASVPWSGVTGKPDFAALYAAIDHSHTAAEVGAIATTDAVTAAQANKLLYLDENAKLPASITGDAMTLNGHADTYFAQASHTHAHTDITDFDAEVNALISTAMEGVGHVVVGTDAPAEASDIGAKNMYIQLI